MTRFEKFKIHLRAFRFEAMEMLIDAWLFFVPVFVFVGFVSVSVKIWLWVLF